MDYKGHIQGLCEGHGITVKSHTGNGRAWRKTRTIAIREVKSAITYALALHEIGHVVGKQGKYRLEKELLAWQWAKDNALVWTGVMQDKMDKCYLSYVRKAERTPRMIKA